MSNDEKSLRPEKSAHVARVGAPSRLITRGLDRLRQRERRCIDLPTPPGESSRIWPSAINNRGQIVGMVGSRPVLWEQGRMIVLDMIMRDIETRPGWGFLIDDLNDFAQIVGHEARWGTSHYRDRQATASKAVLWDSRGRFELSICW